MDWSDVKGLVGKASPIIGTLLGGAPGAAVGSLVASALGVDNTPVAVAEAMRSDPEAAVKIAELESRERIEFERLALREVELAQQDRQSARERDTQIQKAKGSNRRGDFLAFAAITGFIVMLVCLFMVKLSPETRDVVLVMVGILGAIVKDVYQFEFGSSRGSKDKDRPGVKS